MKHPSTRAFHAYWDQTRGSARAPERGQFAPGPVRELLADIFMVAYDHAAAFPFRMAGTRICATLGSDPTGQSFTALFDHASQRDITDLIGIVAEDMLPTVAGVKATAAAGTPVHLEMLLLPFSPRAHTPLTLAGLLVPLDAPAHPLQSLSLTSWRHIHPERPKGPRLVQKLAIAKGLMVYEGLI